MKTYEDVPFDVVKAQNGSTVVTRSGLIAEFVYYNNLANPDAQVCAVVDDATRMFYENGTYYQTGPDDESEYDLFIRQEIDGVEIFNLIQKGQMDLTEFMEWLDGVVVDSYYEGYGAG